MQPIKQTISPIYPAVKLNNDGVRQMIAGNVESAKGLFIQAVDVLNELASQNDIMSQLPNNNKITPLSPYSLRRANILSPHELTVSPEESSNQQKEDATTDGFTFYNLITFVRSPSRKNCYNAEDWRMYCAVILLNLAIVHHRDGLQQTIQQGVDSILNQADGFYQQVLKLVPGSSGTDEQIMVKLVAMNNLAQIQSRQTLSNSGLGKKNEMTFQVLQLLFVQLVKKESSCSISGGTGGIVDEYGESLLDAHELRAILHNIMASDKPKKQR